MLFITILLYTILSDESSGDHNWIKYDFYATPIAINIKVEIDN